MKDRNHERRGQTPPAGPVTATLERIPVGESVREGDWWYYSAVDTWMPVRITRGLFRRARKVMKLSAPHYRITGLGTRKRPRLVYLAVPYTHPEEAVREARFAAANVAAARLMKSGIHVFSPISHSHPIALSGDLPGDWTYWKEYCATMLSACTEMIVVTLPGWMQSVGVKTEIQIAERLGLPVSYLEHETEEAE